MSKIIQSYVSHKDKCFFVSTINRGSSAQLNPHGTYAETMAWEWDEEAKVRGAMVGQDESSTDSMHAHFAGCKRLYETGLFAEPEED